MEVGKVLPIADDISFGNLIEHGVAEDRHDKEDQHEQDENVEEGVDGHHDCLEQRLQAFVLAS